MEMPRVPLLKDTQSELLSTRKMGHGPKKSGRRTLGSKEFGLKKLARADPHHCQHASRFAMLCAMREKLARTARGTVFERRDVCFRHSHGQQLAAIGFTQIKMQLDTWISMARRSLVHEQHGIAFAHGVRFLHAVKEVGGVIELRVKRLFHFFTNFKAATLDSRADRSVYIFRARAKFLPHDAHAFFHDAFDRAAPARMKRANGFALGIDQQDRKTISRQDAESDAAQIGHHPIASHWPGLK